MIPDPERRDLTQSLGELIVNTEGTDSPTDPMTLVSRAEAVSEISRSLLTDAVRSARAQGVSWALLGKELGMSRQAAQQRFGSPGRADDDLGKEFRWLGPVMIVDELAELREAGVLGWRAVGVELFRYRMQRTDTQWEHQRVLWSPKVKRLTDEGWEVAIRALPWIYLVRDTGLPAKT